ncbi:hypothetical protein INT44_000627 [Umbelopsis vinacea]|uniref:EF-hand domain-containing protein n=1 Tax=Umbelopsis vinacea TaxID=44442 RepID=A0A8H7Q8B7_9FUNG|nr:hypothetical protein INT44_000627 [Umbelopsis vinacea]KAI9289812.1 hypothetical protein BC943DRAFT_315209 [Umbelopsis sp. AD052]
MFSRVQARLPAIYQLSRTYASAAYKKKSKIAKYTVVGIATGSALGAAYHLSKDDEVIYTAEGAHLTVPEQAFKPKLGGYKNLPVVSHFLDDSIHEENTKPRLVVIGSGWGAVSVLEQLEKDDYNVTLISENNYFLFTPLLPSATVGTLEMRSLLEPIRKITDRVKAHFLQVSAKDVDFESKLVEVTDPSTGKDFYVPYDKLVIAVGATSMTHGVEGLENTYQLKTIQDAIKIRRQVLENLEVAALPTTPPEERKRLLSFVVCGGGPTGVEFAAELFDTLNEDLVRWFPKVLREEVSVTIIQSRDHILNTFDTSISAYAEKKFDRERIKIVTNARVQKIDENSVQYTVKNAGDPSNPETVQLPYGFCLWSTGISMTPFARNISEKLEAQKHQRALVTDGTLKLKGIPDGSVYAIGDCATIENPKLLSHIMEICEAADKNKDGSLTFEEFVEAGQYMCRRFPLATNHLSKMSELFKKYDIDNSGTLEIDELRVLLTDLDKKTTNLPATAQVANQQGKYLGKSISRIAKASRQGVSEDQVVQPFAYHHLGSLAYLGNTAVGEFNWGYKMVGGLWALYLWRSVYWSEQVSLRTRLNLSIDWTKGAIWGRDLSAI